jgi:hypothetical protein
MMLTAWTGHTEESRAIAVALSDAIDAEIAKPQDVRTLTSREDAAKVMQTTRTLLARQLSGMEPLNLWRVGYLPPVVRIAFFSLALRQMGAAVLTPEEKQFVLSFVGMGAKRMARVAERFTAEKRFA